ncbi:ABC transporter [Ignicoccus pacificus DSM 13166]|uniref:ABC transporter n=1 Tax=Ignicoccus pacificus DSM 13166 TaxID=940294 RepID=A0A977K9Y6_9CREN|nr:ABC transporter [Ignicoccus pacificus DSM 13166]
MIEVEDLKVYYYSRRGVVKAVDGVSFDVKEGESLGIAGESGCGKSTTAMALMRLIEPPGKIVGGKIQIDEFDALSMPDNKFRKEVRWKRISMVFQGAMNSLTPVYTVFDHFVETLKAHDMFTTKEEAREKAIKLLKMVGLKEEILERYPHELSGGQKQRVVIALALLLDPKYVIADEPTTALDVVVQAQIINALKDLQEKVGMSLILITHDLGVLSELSDKILVMYAGKAVEYGPLEKVLGNPLHPYTQLLLQATPKISGGELKWIPGSPPDLANPPKGCRFRPRCPKAFDKCKEEPKMKEVEHNHWVACHLY